MADDASDANAAGDRTAAGQPHNAPSMEERGFTIATQYLKDLSVENPNAPLLFVDMQEAPQISVNLDVNVGRLRQRSYEVVLSAHIEAKAKTGEGEEQTAFVVELEYGGLVTLDEGVSEDRAHRLLLIEAPRYLFPFARNVISAATRDAGFPPLLIDPIDFEKLYRRHGGQQAPAAADGVAGNGHGGAAEGGAA